MLYTGKMATAIVDGNLILAGLEHLLSNYPYHPVLWTLYAVNKRLASYKPRLGKSIEVFNYYRVENPWLGGITESLHDILAIDDTTGKECWYAYATICEGVENVPREWAKRIVVNERRNFVLLPYEFCCRQVLKRSDCKIVRCQSHFIPAKFFVDQYYFHIGCGECNQELSMIISGFPQYAGIKQLVLALGDEGVTDRADVMMHLLSGGEAQKIMFENVKVEKSHIYSSGHVRSILQHILLCIQCNKHLKKFLGVLERCLCRDDSLKGFDEISRGFILNNSIPCDEYVIDGEFDEMRETAYNAILLHYIEEKDPHIIVNNFISDYYK